jgi:hypothetical protein
MKYHGLKKGDIVKPDPLWNETSEPNLHLPDECVLLDIQKPINGDQVVCGTGILFKVALKNGCEVHMDSAWFILPENCTERNTGLKNMLRKRRYRKLNVLEY